MEFKTDYHSGYKYCYNPEHPLANSAGKVMEHVFVMVKHLGRPLKTGECVHHKDRVRSNNSIDNLQVMTMQEHGKLHAAEDRDFKTVEKTCINCGNCFTTTQISRRVYCSCDCAHACTQRFTVEPSELETLVWAMPSTMVAKLFGVSDVAIAKRCKKLGISKPPRGYWAKTQSL